MSLMSGLVETPAEQVVAVAKRAGFGDWFIRHAWKLAVGFSAVVWLIVAALIALL
jgi:hypothetical protein